MPKRKRRDSLPPMVRVTWQDASHNSDAEVTADHDEEEMGVIMVTVGHLISDTEQGIRIGVDFYMDGSERFRGVTDIPRAYVLKVRKFK